MRIARHFVPRDPLEITAQRKSLVAPLARLRAFLFPSLQEASFLRSENKKALLLSQQGFSFVAEGGFEPPTFGL